MMAAATCVYGQELGLPDNSENKPARGKNQHFILGYH